MTGCSLAFSWPPLLQVWVVALPDLALREFTLDGEHSHKLLRKGMESQSYTFPSVSLAFTDTLTRYRMFSSEACKHLHGLAAHSPSLRRFHSILFVPVSLEEQPGTWASPPDWGFWDDPSISLFFIYVCCPSLCMYTVCSRKGSMNPQRHLWSLRGCWELNLAHLQEQQVCLTTDLSL